MPSFEPTILDVAAGDDDLGFAFTALDEPPLIVRSPPVTSTYPRPDFGLVFGLDAVALAVEVERAAGYDHVILAAHGVVGALTLIFQPVTTRPSGAGDTVVGVAGDPELALPPTVRSADDARAADGPSALPA